jgi:hypothetical protein
MNPEVGTVCLTSMGLMRNRPPLREQDSFARNVQEPIKAPD